MRVGGLVLMMLSLAPSTAEAIALIPTGTTAFPISVSIGGSLFGQARSIHAPGQDAQTQFALTRARIALDLRWLHYLRLQLEPDFAGAEAEPADLFAEARPVRELGIVIGRAKVPFGELELEGRWRLPSVRRGLVSNVVTDRQGIGDRKLGATASLRFKDVLLKPGIDVGAYRDTIDDPDTDGAVRLEMRPYFKGSQLSVAGYARGGLAADGGYGFAGSVAFLYDKHGAYALIEGILDRGALLQKDGVAEVDATLTAAHLLLAYSIGWSSVAFEPYVGFEVLDPNARTRDDFGWAIRGGLNFLFLDLFRLALEVDHQQGQQAFPEPDRTIITIFAGVHFE